MVSLDRKQTSELDMSHSPRQVILKELFHTLSICSSLRWVSDIILTIQTCLCIAGHKSKWLPIEERGSTDVPQPQTTDRDAHRAGREVAGLCGCGRNQAAPPRVTEQ